MTETTKTQAEMRVMIAKDVLLQVKEGFLNPECGVYFAPNHFGNFKETEQAWQLCGGVYGEGSTPEVGNTQLQSLLDKDKGANKPCRACAIGGVFISAVRLFNKLNLKDFATSSVDMHMQYLHEWFPAKMLSDMEDCFEKDDDLPDPSDDDENTFQDYKDAFAKKRLVHIFENIIKNDGEFVEGELPELEEYMV